MMNFVFKNEESCITNEELCITNEESCIKIDEFCSCAWLFEELRQHDDKRVERRHRYGRGGWLGYLSRVRRCGARLQTDFSGDNSLDVDVPAGVALPHQGSSSTTFTPAVGSVLVEQRRPWEVVARPEKNARRTVRRE